MIVKDCVSEPGLTVKGNSFGMVEIFQIVIVVVVLKLQKCVKLVNLYV